MSVEAIYLLTPTTQNVDRVIMDWTGRRMYKAAHLFFIDGTSHLASILHAPLAWLVREVASGEKSASDVEPENEADTSHQVSTMAWRRS